MDDEVVAGRLSTETLDERRARLITAPPDRSSGRLVALAMAVLGLVVGIWFGIVPGSAAFGRYPVWELYELANRIDGNPDLQRMGCDGTFGPRASVNLVTGRVEIDGVYVPIRLTDEERAMIEGPVYEQVSTGPADDIAFDDFVDNC